MPVKITSLLTCRSRWIVSTNRRISSLNFFSFSGVRTRQRERFLIVEITIEQTLSVWFTSSVEVDQHISRHLQGGVIPSFGRTAFAFLIVEEPLLAVEELSDTSLVPSNRSRLNRSRCWCCLRAVILAMEGSRREPARVQASYRPSDQIKYDPVLAREGQISELPLRPTGHTNSSKP